jgi:hypothetical protein
MTPISKDACAALLPLGATCEAGFHCLSGACDRERATCVASCALGERDRRARPAVMTPISKDARCDRATGEHDPP